MCFLVYVCVYVFLLFLLQLMILSFLLTKDRPLLDHSGNWHMAPLYRLRRESETIKHPFKNL